ncbi:hypothetical protein ACIU1J_11285 [Azospirillum doebereinerae]|uniref:hypothetical protein n=1 Tax=Azospirillum doebereinerae TaxID=92933 RepID=UPI00384B0950
MRWGGAAGWWCDGDEYRAVADGYAADLAAVSAAAAEITVPALPPVPPVSVPPPWTAPPRPPTPPPSVVDPPPVSPPTTVTPPASAPDYDCLAVTITRWTGCNEFVEDFVVIDGPHAGLTGPACAARGSAGGAPAGGIGAIYRVYAPTGFFDLPPYDPDTVPGPVGECGDRTAADRWSVTGAGLRLLPLGEFLSAINGGGAWWALGQGPNAGTAWGGGACAAGADC